MAPRRRIPGFHGFATNTDLYPPGFRGFQTNVPRPILPTFHKLPQIAPSQPGTPVATSTPAPAPAPVDPNQAGMDYLRSAYGSVAGQARTDQATAQQQIDQLAGLAGSGYAPGSVQDQTAKQQASTLAAIQAASGSKFPSVLEAAGAGAAQQYAMGANAARAQSSVAQLQAAQKMMQDRQSLAAQLRGQNLNVIAAKLAAGGSLTRAELAAQTSLATNQQDNQAALDRAQLSAQTSQANVQARIQAQIAKEHQAAAKTRNAQNKEIFRRNAKALGLVQHLAGGTINPDGTRQAYSFDDIITNLLQNYDLTPAEAKKIAKRGLGPYVSQFRKVAGGF